MSNEESMNQKHLRVVNKIAAIFEEEFDDADDIFFVIRTLRNIFLWDQEDQKTEWIFERALDKFAKKNPEFMKKYVKL